MFDQGFIKLAATIWLVLSEFQLCLSDHGILEYRNSSDLTT